MYTLLILLMCASASAELLPASTYGLNPPAIQVTDETNENFLFQELQTTDRPVLLLPAFMKCHASCPVMTQTMKKALTESAMTSSFKVIIFSFDHSDTSADVARYRKEQQIPETWQIIRTKNASAIRQFFDAFDYRFMDEEGGGYLHPNEIFVLSPQLRWSGTFRGIEMDPVMLRDAFNDALEADHPSLFRKLYQWGSLPQNWIILACVILVLVLVWLYRLVITGRI